MLQGEILLRQFLKTNNNVIARNIGPRASRDERGSSTLVLGIREDAQRRPLDIDSVAGLDQLLSDGGGDGGAVLERLGLGTDVEDV